MKAPAQQESRPLMSTEAAPAAQGDWCLGMLQAFSFATAVAAAVIVGVNVYAMATAHESAQMYAVIFCSLVILAEVERPKVVLVYFKFLEVWTLKGLFISFVGVLTLDTEARRESLLQSVAALLTISLGAVYFVLGLMCIKTYRDGLQGNLHGPPDASDLEEPLVPPQPPQPKAPQADCGSGPSWLNPMRDC
ncbi:hypothetical protein M885DRAFT_612968 [Pelagophyceae sp. CCMP2097]|nr:hypothetical protein M885DRAFT_612968 [Pelagophyceae sp. CCMP2097]